MYSGIQGSSQQGHPTAYGEANTQQAAVQPVQDIISNIYERIVESTSRLSRIADMIGGAQPTNGVDKGSVGGPLALVEALNMVRRQLAELESHVHRVEVNFGIN